MMSLRHQFPAVAFPKRLSAAASNKLWTPSLWLPDRSNLTGSDSPLRFESVAKGPFAIAIRESRRSPDTGIGMIQLEH
ncbi:hypothetical protein CO2235_MP80306 [Cupriavidus oxalaticus]|uniref:Uncharacterized protein n=1 Tax=Cupriavidus oxalaticus TaxID=96344 RepID=A0A375FQ36_9BURK|nr:hypothetical protein CO2235_U770181 [Cupriavidus oxalaticus]SPC24426.1 hypothetical protein CO2235_MP80306 [Cupriavidus oxalaticus]